MWNYGYEGDPTIVETYVSQLRKKIDTSPPTIFEPSEVSVIGSNDSEFAVNLARQTLERCPGVHRGHVASRAVIDSLGGDIRDPTDRSAVGEFPPYHENCQYLERSQSACRSQRRPPRFNTSHFSALYLAIVSEGRRTSTLDTSRHETHIAPVADDRFDVAREPTIVTVSSRTGSDSWRAVLSRATARHAEILVAAPLNQVDSTIGFFDTRYSSRASSFSPCFIATGYWISRLGLRPIAEVTGVAEAIVEGDRTRRVATRRPRTEAGKLARAFNVMLDEQQALEAQASSIHRRRIARTSHTSLRHSRDHRVCGGEASCESVTKVTRRYIESVLPPTKWEASVEDLFSWHGWTKDDRWIVSRLT